MSTGNLTARNRAYSQVAIRKRLIRTNSEDRQKDLAKNSTTTSFRPKFDRLIQEGKIEQIMNTDPHTKAHLFYTTHINQLQKELSSTKKSLSTMVLKSKAKEFNINKIKNQIGKVEREQTTLRSESLLNKNKRMDSEHKLKQKRDDAEDKAWVEKCYNSMNYKLGKDQDYLRAREAERHSTVDQLKKERALLESEYYNLCQFNKKLEYNLGKAKEISREQTDEKNQFIELLNIQMAERDMLNDLKIVKNERENHINNLAPSVIEKEELQKYLQILFTHKLLGQIIKNKSQKLIEQYSTVQNAFMHIRSNTNISETNKVLERMESQDQQYESLLGKVNGLQKQLLGMDSKMVEAAEKQNKILSKDGKGEEGKDEGYYQGIEKDNYQMLILEKEKLADRNKQDQILKKRIISWVQDYSSHFRIDSKSGNEEGFMEGLKRLGSQINRHINPDTNKQHKNEPTKKDINKDTNKDVKQHASKDIKENTNKDTSKDANKDASKPANEQIKSSE